MSFKETERSWASNIYSLILTSLFVFLAFFICSYGIELPSTVIIVQYSFASAYLLCPINDKYIVVLCYRSHNETIHILSYKLSFKSIRRKNAFKTVFYNYIITLPILFSCM